jgi:hypothetical protein
MSAVDVSGDFGKALLPQGVITAFVVIAVAYLFVSAAFGQTYEAQQSSR